MIEFISSWVKGLGIAIVIVSILEMLLPNNKTKKYIRMVMGIYVLFTIISPFISNKESLNINDIDLEKYTITETSTQLDQTSMNERIEELYIQELEKDITKKLEEQGYEVLNCKVDAQITDNEEDTKINKIEVDVQKSQEQKSDETNIEEEMVTQIQKIKPIDTSISNEDSEQVETDENKNTQINKSDIQNIKKFLIEEYEVNEKCLEIN